MPFEDRLFAFNTIESKFKYKIRCQSELNQEFDNQDLIQVGTDKDWIDRNPDIQPEVGVGLNDSTTIWISWTGDNANAGTQAAPKRSFLTNYYNSVGTGALSAARSSGKNLCFVTGSTDMWVEDVIIPNDTPLYKAQFGDTPTLRTCRRTLIAGGFYTDATAKFVDPNVAGAGTGTQADPYKSLQTAIDNAGAGIIVIFNSGVSGTPGDNVSLVFNETLESLNPHLMITVGIRFANNWFTPGDTAFISYGNLLADFNQGVANPPTDYFCGSSFITYFSTEQICFITNNRYIWVGVEGNSFTQYDVTGGSEVLYDGATYGTYIYIATASRIRRATSPYAAFADATAVSGFYRLESWNGLLYGWSASGIYSTSDGTTWTSFYTFDTSYTPVFRPIEFEDKLYFFDNNTRELYYIDRSNTAIKESYVNWDSLQAMEVLNGYMYFFCTRGSEYSIYSYDGETYSLIFSSSNTVYQWNVLCKSYLDCIYVSSNNTTTEYIYLFDGLTLTQMYSGATAGNITDCFRPSVPIDSNVSIYSQITNNTIICIPPIVAAGADVKKLRTSNYRIGGANTEIYGLAFVDTKICPFALGSYIQTDTTIVKYCNFDNYRIAAMNYTYDSEFKNNISSNMKYTLYLLMQISTVPTNDYDFNLHYNISEIALNIYHALGTPNPINLDYNTFDNVKQAFYLDDGVNPDETLIISYCIFSRVGTIGAPEGSVNYCVIPPNCITSGLTLDSNCITAIPFYRNRDEGDYRLQAIGGYSDSGNLYQIDSPGVGMGSYTTGRLGNDEHGDAYTFLNDGDAGCYQIAIALYSWDWNEEWLMRPYPNSLQFNPLFKSKTSFQSREGSISKTFQSIKKQFIFQWADDNPWGYDDIYKLLNLLEFSYKMMLSYNVPLASEYTFTNQAAWLASQLRLDIIAKKVGITSGQESNVFTKADMTLVTTNTWLPNQFKGFYVRLIDQTDQDPGSSFVPRQSLFRIDSNTATTLYLSNPFLENLGKYGATVNVGTDDLMFIISDIKVLFDVDNDLSYAYQILSGLNQEDEFPRNLVSNLTFEEIL